MKRDGWDRTKPIPNDFLEHEINFAMALGVVERWSVRRPTDVRRYTLVLRDGTSHEWTPQTVHAFTIGVRLSSERRTA